MRRQAITVLAAALLGGIALVVAGCGSTTTTTTTTSSAAPASSTSTTASTTTPAAATTTPAPSLPPGLSLLTSANCLQLYNLAQAFSAALTGAGLDTTKTAALLKDFASKTPSDIRPDFQVIADAYAKIAAALKGVNLSSGKVPSADVIAKLTKLSTEINQAKVTQASTNISTWATKNCTKPK